MTPVYRLNNLMYQLVNVSFASVLPIIRFGNVVRAQLSGTPTMKMTDDNLRA